MSNDSQYSNPSFSDASFSDQNLEQAVKEIRHDEVDGAVMEAAAARVWNKLQEQAADSSNSNDGPHSIRGCGDFQVLFPEYRAGSLAPAKKMLVQDHLHQCVACRRVYEGRVTPIAAPRTRPAATRYPVRWAAAAVVVAAAGMSVWVIVNHGNSPTGHAIVQSVNGALFEVTPQGIRPLAAGAALPDGIEIRTAPETDAVLQLRDGSLVEMRERSGMSAESSASDMTIHLTRGSVIVQAAKRSAGHLYVVTSECRVSVTGTLFGVTAGIKGSRVSVLEGEVRVSQDNQERVLHPGDQSVSGEGLEPEPVRDDIAWSRNRDRYFTLLGALRTSLQNVPLGDLRYSSKLIRRLPPTTMLYAAVPNLATYLGTAETTLRAKLAENADIAGMSDSHNLMVLDKLRAASGYLGDEVVIAAQPANGGLEWVFFAEVKRAGFADFLQQNLPSVKMQTRNGFVLFGLDSTAVAQFASALDTDSGGFADTPFYQKIDQAYHDGAGLLFCMDLATTNRAQRWSSARYVLAEQREVDHRMEASATLVFDKERHGMAGWLAAPAPMGSLEYISPEASFASAFVTRNAGAIVDELSGMFQQVGGKMDVSAPGLRDDLAAGVGGEFGLALDGPVLPTPSWKLVVEVYDRARFQAAMGKLVDAYNAYTAKTGGLPLRHTEETVDGQTYYMIAGNDPNPLTEAHYTFSDGYMIAAPSLGLVKRALDIKKTRNTLPRSTLFTSLAPRDRNANFSAVVYENLGPTLSPIAGLLDGLIQSNGGPGIAKRLSTLKPSVIAAYGGADRLTVATDQNFLGGGLMDMMTGNVAGVVQNLVPLPQVHGFGHGSTMRQYEGTPRR